jgi:hypothetical protein
VEHVTVPYSQILDNTGNTIIVNFFRAIWCLCYKPFLKLWESKLGCFIMLRIISLSVMFGDYLSGASYTVLQSSMRVC